MNNYANYNIESKIKINNIREWGDFTISKNSCLAFSASAIASNFIFSASLTFSPINFFFCYNFNS